MKFSAKRGYKHFEPIDYDALYLDFRVLTFSFLSQDLSFSFKNGSFRRDSD